MAEDEGGISIKEGVASNRFLSGPQAQSAIGALKTQQRVAGRAPGKLRQAAAEARNQLRHIQAQRAASMRGSGVAAGGGAGGGSGTAQMRQDIASAAQQMAAEQAVQGAEEKAALVGTEVTSEIGKIKQQQQAYAPNFVSDISAEISEMVGAGQKPAAVGASVATKLSSLDMGDPVQRQAAIDGLGLWLGQRGWSATPAQIASIVDSGKAGFVAARAGIITPGGRSSDPAWVQEGGVGSVATLWRPPQSTTA
jgi:hypothetical protein